MLTSAGISDGAPRGATRTYTDGRERVLGRRVVIRHGVTPEELVDQLASLLGGRSAALVLLRAAADIDRAAA